MNRADFQALAEVRIREAQALLTMTPPMPDGAYYLAGYAVECALKAVIAKGFGLHEWPEKSFINDCHTHDLARLIKLANLEDDMTKAGMADPVLAKHWSTAKKWSEQTRYKRFAITDAQAIISAITDPTNGVLQWIKARW